MSIEQRGPKAWRVEIEWKDPVTGERQRVRRHVNGTKRQAEALESQLKADRSRGIDLSPEHVTVSELMDRWMKDYAARQVAPRTYTMYGIRADRAKRALGHVKLSELRPAHVKGYQTDLLADGLSSQTVLHHHRTLSQALTWAVDMGLLHHNPATNRAVRPPKVEHKPLRTLDAAEARHLLSALTDGNQRRMVQFALETGMRIGEQCGLKWSDVDLDASRLTVQRSIRARGGGITIRQPKTARGRRAIALSPSTISLLRDQKRAQTEARLQSYGAYDVDSDWVWTDALGGVLNQDRVSLRFSRTVRVTGFPGLRWHDLRHSHASISIAAGLNVKLVSERLGHSTPAFTLATYVHTTDEAHAAAAAQFERALALG